MSLVPGAVSATAGAPNDNSDALPPDHWRKAADLPLAVQEIYAAVHAQSADAGERLYVAGGIAARLAVPYFTNRCVSFSAAENAWREEANLPESLHHAALASNGKRLTLAGGFNGGYTHIWRMRDQVYTLGAAGWEATTALPKPQAEGVFCSHGGGALHLVTGQSPRGEANSARSDHREVTEHWVLAEGAAQWEALAPIPTARNSATGGWLDARHLVVTGGRTAAGNLAATEIYDHSEDRWRTAAPMPQPQAGTASVIVGDSLLVFGGEIFQPEADVFAQCWRYRLSTDQWEALPDMRTPRHGLGAGRLGDAVYVVGGAIRPSGSGTSSLNEALPLGILAS